MTDETKHTPGPWRLGFPGRDDEHMCVVMTAYASGDEGYEKSFDVICKTFDPNHIASSVRIHHKEKMANARLIAAAPEMLNALDMFPDPADFANSEDYREATNRWWDDKALPAINAAKGNK